MLSNHKSLLGQLVRYVVGGAGLAVVFALVYELVLFMSPRLPQLANAIAFMVSTSLGFLVHSRWSFRDRASQLKGDTGPARFLIINLVSYILNGFWVWLVVEYYGFSSHAPLLLILGVTPWLSFWLNRQWTFGKD